VTKERRLGRGLEALLGQLPARNEPTVAAQPNRAPTISAAPETNTPASPAAPAVPSAEALFRLDLPHGGPGQFVGQAHHPPVHAPQPAPAPSAAPAPTVVPKPAAAPTRVDVRQIDSNPAQPRQDFGPEEMKSLAESISTHGLLQPVVVRRVHERYQLVAGERRLRAAIQAGWVDVPVNVIEADDRQVAELAIVENLQRKDLNALEKAASFQKYLGQYGCTQEELAGRLKLDRSTIANLIRLLELPEPVQEAIRGKISQGHARALLPLGDEPEQIAFCQRIQREGLNVRQTEVLVQETIAAADHEPLGAVETPGQPGPAPRAKSEHIAALEQQFRTALGMKVKISHNARGRGKLVVQFRNHEEFSRLKKHICGR
jgi:ParB family chromosome partitioning protein